MNCRTSQHLIGSKASPLSPELENHIDLCPECQSFATDVKSIDLRLSGWRNETAPMALSIRSKTPERPLATSLMPLALAVALVGSVGWGLHIRSAHVPAGQLKESLIHTPKVASAHLFAYQLDPKTKKLVTMQGLVDAGHLRVEGFGNDRYVTGPGYGWSFSGSTGKITKAQRTETKGLKTGPGIWLAANILFPDESGWSAEERANAAVPRSPKDIPETTDLIGSLKCRRFDFVTRSGLRSVLWVDPETSLTVRIATLDDDGKKMNMVGDLVWNEAIDPVVFQPESLKTPLLTTADPYPIDTSDLSVKPLEVRKITTAPQHKPTRS